MMIKITKKYFSGSVSNYYLGFHKENSINNSSIKFDNILSKRLDDHDYIIPKPNYTLEGSFADKYIKQVMAVIMNKNLLESREIMQEAKEKAQQYLKIKGFNVGAYSDSKGIPFVRKNLANWYYERDGYKIDEDSIYLTNGGINAYDHIISLITESGDSVLLPNPCYPIYKRYNLANSVENLYYEFEGIEEGKPTGINFKQLSNTVSDNRKKGKTIKALVVINPHNPLGTILTESEMQQVVEFCEKNHLVLIAIETLQKAIFPRLIHGKVETTHSNLNAQAEISYRDIEGNKFTPSQDERFKSFRHIVNKMNSKQELFSIYSASKGPFYQQSLRAGLLDFMNLEEQVSMQMYKYKSIDLCSGVPGQIIMDLTLNKPKEFGYEFLFNFEQSLNQFNTRMYQAKTFLYEHFKSECNVVPRDIEAGYSFYVKTTNPNLEVKIRGVDKIASEPGSLYGDNMGGFKNFFLKL